MKLQKLHLLSYQFKQKMSKLVENYLLQEPIGKGVYGQVYKAIHQGTNKVFAVKVIPKASFRSNPKLEQLAINEINILSSVKHENIVKFIETLKTTNNFYFVYEFCNEGTLESQLQNKRYLKEPEALIYFKQLLEAFKQLNKNNIMHRDLKPDNIFLSDGKVKLGDFGFCKMLEVNMAQTMLGSPIYMAPQILKQEIYTSKADIWSLGVVLFEMLFGYCPFESSSISELINKLKVLEVEIPHNINQISEETEILLKKMLVKDQFKRIQWADLFGFVIDNAGKIISGCKKQFRIQTLENCLFNSNASSVLKIPLKEITSQKQMPSFQNDKKLNQKSTDPRCLDNTNVSSENMIPEFESSKDTKGKDSQKIEGTQKTGFREQHKKWVQAICFLENIALNSVEANRDEQCLIILLSHLLQTMEQNLMKYPQQSEIIDSEIKQLKQGLSELIKSSETICKGVKESKDSELKELYQLWKGAKNKFTLERAIRAVLDQPCRDIPISEILI